MKRVAISGALACAFAVMASGASAQLVGDNPPVKIENKSGETRKICFHKPKRVTLFAIGCVELNNGEHIFWNRKSEFTPFKIKVYKTRKLIDKYLYARDLPGDTGKITIGTGTRFGYTLFKKMRKRFTVRVCNTQYADPVYFALGLDYVRFMYSEGWWSVARGECKNIPITKRAKENWNEPYHKIPRVFYSARTYGKKPLFWNRGEGERVFCFNPKKRFKGMLGGGNFCKKDAEGQPYRFLSAPTERSNETINLTF